MALLSDGTTPLEHLGVIRATGEDAARFLHGQLTQDFALLKDDQARLAAFCTAKGRMLASFIGLRRPDGDILLVTPRDTLPATLKRLSMFVLRAKVRLSDATAQFALHGLTGTLATQATAGLPVWGKREEAAASVIALHPADGVARALRIVPAEAAAPAGPALPLALWQWSEVRSGIAWVSTPVAEAFVPQMLNYESVGGVNFKKGCYPGQEVVARSQFRGTLKRRGFVVHAHAALQAGQDVFHASDRDQPCGTVAQAAPSPAGGWDAIVSMQTTAAEGGVLTAGGPDGPALALQPLPYELLADV